MSDDKYPREPRNAVPESVDNVPQASISPQRTKVLNEDDDLTTLLVPDTGRLTQSLHPAEVGINSRVQHHASVNDLAALNESQSAEITNEQASEIIDVIEHTLNQNNIQS